jgi:hypothetical protein
VAVPKPRREGGRGGMNHTGSQARSARRGGNPGKYGGPPKKGCAVIALALIAIPAVIAGTAGVYYLA